LAPDLRVRARATSYIVAVCKGGFASCCLPALKWPKGTFDFSLQVGAILIDEEE
jgi:hypothetical protein